MAIGLGSTPGQAQAANTAREQWEVDRGMVPVNLYFKWLQAKNAADDRAQAAFEFSRRNEIANRNAQANLAQNYAAMRMQQKAANDAAARNAYQFGQTMDLNREQLAANKAASEAQLAINRANAEMRSDPLEERKRQFAFSSAERLAASGMFQPEAFAGRIDPAELSMMGSINEQVRKQAEDQWRAASAMAEMKNMEAELKSAQALATEQRPWYRFGKDPRVEKIGQDLSTAAAALRGYEKISPDVVVKDEATQKWRPIMSRPSWISQNPSASFGANPTNTTVQPVATGPIMIRNRATRQVVPYKGPVSDLADDPVWELAQ